MEDIKIPIAKTRVLCNKCNVYINYKNFRRHERTKYHLRKLRKILK